MLSEFGTGGKGIRTPGLLIANETLYQLSYTPGQERKLSREPIVSSTLFNEVARPLAVTFEASASLAQTLLSYMSVQTTAETTARGRADLTSDRTSELNNLLQIISSTGELINDITKSNPSCAKYIKMLRESIERATQITTELVRQSGGCEKEALLRPDFSDFIRSNAAASSMRDTQSLLVVDDEPMALNLARQILGQAGFQVTTASSGFECIELCRSKPKGFDLVILDLTMPGMDGAETFARLRTICPELSIVISTGFIAQEKLNHMLAAGLTGFIRKPMPPDEYVGHIRAILSKASFWQANAPSA
jgi:CheY-like chemotaxis protein